jgi:methionyl-tRNA formyltransferase
MHKPLNFLLLGSGAHFTFRVLKQLLSFNYQPLAYIQHGSQEPDVPSVFENIPVVSHRSLTPVNALSIQHDINFYYQNSLQLDVWIRQMSIDFLLVACWPELIPAEIIDSVNCAAVNLHPSMLPAFRGFDPLSDQLNSSDSTFGVSLHLLNDTFDSGDIVLQEVVKIAPGANRLDIEIQCAEKGAELFIRALQSYAKPGWSLIKQPLSINEESRK